MLSSEEYSGARREFNDEDWKGATGIVSRYYNLVLADCGAGLFQPASRGVLSTVSGLVIVASASIDGARQAAVTMDWLRQNGYQDLLGRSCVVINHVVPGKPNIDVDDLVQQFERHVAPGRVIVLPWDKHIAAGTEIQLDLLGQDVPTADHRTGCRAVRRLRQARASLTTTAAAPSTPGVTPGRPSTTRVTILTGRRLTDLVLPASAPIETYVDETVAVLAELLEDTPADVLAGFDFKAQGVWAFARPGAPPLKASESLDDAGVVDGALLTLVSVSRTERYRPLVEDVIDAIAVLDESPEFDRTALNRFVGLAIPAVTLVITGASMRAWSDTGHSWWWAVALGVLGLGVLGGSVMARTRYRNFDMAESLLLASVPLLAGAAALAVPLPIGISGLGAPNVAGAAAVATAARVGHAWRAAQASRGRVVHRGLGHRDHRCGDRVRLRVGVLGALQAPSPSV